MTAADIEAALTLAGLGWHQPTDRLVIGAGTPNFCNSRACETYAKTATLALVTADEMAAALLAALGGDRTDYNAITAAAKA